ncbi:mitochondrial ribosome-associated GTPase 1 isoform X2 [Monodon monoceros]|uniref:mitochondrial ribosome-associated GTPase 1 isoform X2 n=1 Tax=Monodon monoceros TaxID=40151 RepID=UPI0010F9FEE5|nr:mitochondrial ribosome-associated GTPase 1 isoform X2 [Monodon monoceros]
MLLLMWLEEHKLCKSVLCPESSLCLGDAAWVALSSSCPGLRSLQGPVPPARGPPTLATLDPGCVHGCLNSRCWWQQSQWTSLLFRHWLPYGLGEGQTVPGRRCSWRLACAGRCRSCRGRDSMWQARGPPAWHPPAWRPPAWHPPRGLKKMQSSLKLVDCIIEVHDARIPLSGRNPLFQETLGLKPHLLVLNKMDLADMKEQQKIIQHLEGEGLKNVIFTNCVKDENIKQIIPKVTELVGSSYRYHRGENLEYCIMVIGVPNVGKSSLINSLRRQHLRKGKATRVGGEPGITRAVMSRIQVCERPLMFLLDTPGVLAPRIQSVETGLKLALCGTVLDHLVGEETLADYLLYTLNRRQLLGYVQHYGLGEACDDIASVLKRVAVKLRKTQKVTSMLSSPTTLRPPETSCGPSAAGCWAP